MRVRTIMTSTVIHASVACGLGVWVGAFDAPARPDVTFRIALEREAFELPDESEPEEVEPIPESAASWQPTLIEPEILPDESVFEAPRRDPQEEVVVDDPRPVVEPWVRVRPEPTEEPAEDPIVEEPPPAAPATVPVFVAAKQRDDRNRPPSYPRESVRRNEVGEVMLLLSIDAEGNVISVELDRGCGYPRLHRAAIAAAKAWKFEPALQDGKPVASTKLIPVEFRIAESDE